MVNWLARKRNEQAGRLSDAHVITNAAGISSTLILDVPVSLIDMPTAVSTILGWVKERVPNFVCVRDVHGIMRSQEDPDLLALHHQAGLVTPDGMPLVWLAKSRGHEFVDRVCGADLVDALCAASVPDQVPHYFFGGKDGVAERMIAVLKDRHPGLNVVGFSTPPFRKLSDEEDELQTASIRDTRPGIVWVGLSTPKQEFWMRDHVGQIPGATLLGVGAAFDFYAGDVKRAPQWMRRRGLEWAHRLISEPKRLWRRYLVLAPKFVALSTARAIKGNGVSSRNRK